MAWLVDPKKWDDAWHRQLSYPAGMIWDALLTSRLRLSLPGILPNACEFSLSAVTGKPIEDMKAGLLELQRPDATGKQHLFFDPVYRVVRVPAAPKYNKADNPNILFKWFKEWCDAPNSQLKWDHLESLKFGVNFRRESMAAEWDMTFGRVLGTYATDGTKLISYADLGGESDEEHRRRKPSSKPLPNRSSNGSHGQSKPLPNRSTRSGSGSGSGSEFEFGSGSGSNGFGNRSGEPSDSSNSLKIQSQQKLEDHGPVGQGHTGARVETPDDAGDGQDHPATASPERRRELELLGWRLSPFGHWIPPGFD